MQTFVNLYVFLNGIGMYQHKKKMQNFKFCIFCGAYDL